MGELNELQQARIDAKIAEIHYAYGGEIRDLLKEINKTRLKNKGKLTLTPVIETNSLRWTLSWKEQQKISLELHVIVSVEDDGHAAKVSRVWIHRHAATPVDFDGHTPTTRMRRLASLSIDEIRDAIDAEWS
ncbi:MAG TPA: hypothetical protein VF478_02195 [Anaerolineae bacterium]